MTICFGPGLIIVPLVGLMAVIDAALYDERNPNPMVPALAILASLGTAVVLPLLLLMGVIGLGAAAVGTAASNSPPSERTEPAPIIATEPTADDGQIRLDEPAESTSAALPSAEPDTASEAKAEPTSESPAPLATDEPPPMPAEREYRTWTSGKFTTEAQFVSLTGGVVKLKKRDGTIAELPIDKLSEDDQRYIRSGSFRR